MKTLLWLFAVAVSAATGFYFGIGYGAETLATLAAQNQVTDGVYRLSVSLDALEKNDPEHANRLHEQNFKSALGQIGTNSPNTTYLACSDKDREIMRAAREYSKAHPEVLTGPLQQFKAQGLAWCSQGGA